MHNAPSVSYPVGRCAFQRWLYVFFTVLTSTVLLAWALNQGVTWIWGVAVGFATLAIFSGGRALHQAGMLTWDGQVWCLHDQGAGQGAGRNPDRIRGGGMRTSELTGAALDWAVAKCEGGDVKHLYAWDYSRHKYSTDWAYGGPIIERENISIIR